MIDERDFSHLQRYPGEEGNPFDLVLRAAEDLQQIPSFLFFMLLSMLSTVFSLGDWRLAVFLLLVFLTDWIFLIHLNRSGVSHGPSKPPTLILAMLRGLPVFFTPFWLSVILQFVGTILLVYGFRIEPLSIRVTHKSLRNKLLGFSTPIRLLHLSDLHFEKMTSRERQLNRLIKDIKPDLIVFTGDILNLSFLRDPEAHQAARDLIHEWSAPLGTYLVSGSPAVDLPEVFPDLIRLLPATHLDNQNVTITWEGKKINLIGITCTHRPHLDKEKLFPLIRSDQFNILAYHSPDLTPAAAKNRIDLQLSGHTHGGQVRLPFVGSLVTGSLYGRRFQAGQYNIGNMILYISRGIGMEGRGAPRVRFLCPPEIIVWELV